MIQSLGSISEVDWLLKEQESEAERFGSSQSQSENVSVLQPLSLTMKEGSVAGHAQRTWTQLAPR